MTEREKMITGQTYQAWDTELVEGRQRAKRLLFAYNTLAPDALEQREALLRQLLGGMGENCWIEPPFYCDYGANFTVGADFYANYHCVVLDCAPVTVGNHVMLGPGVQIFTACHPLDAKSRNAGVEFAKPIVIGDDVWIGGGAILLPGVTVGSGTVVGAGSVVTRDLPPGVLAVGNPCRVLRPIAKEQPNLADG